MGRLGIDELAQGNLTPRRISAALLAVNELITKLALSQAKSMSDWETSASGQYRTRVGGPLPHECWRAGCQ